MAAVCVLACGRITDYQGGIQDGLGKVRDQGLCQLLCVPLCPSEGEGSPSMRLKHGEGATTVQGRAIARQRGQTGTEWGGNHDMGGYV